MSRSRGAASATLVVVCAVIVGACTTRDGTVGSSAAKSATSATSSGTPPAIQSVQSWCARLPRAANAALPTVSVRSDWFQVYQVAGGVYALVEPNQWQEVISYLIVGAKQALLFDTGLGLVPIRPVVEQLTTLPITVINSHTHYDHVGGNAEFDHVLAMDIPYTRANMAGFPHAALATEVEAAAFCHGAPAELDTATFHTRAWKSSGVVKNGDVIDLGGRAIEVLHVPGHTPDAVALVDRANKLLFTGDTYYDGPIWLYLPETSLDDYEASMTKLVALARSVTTLLPAHNTAHVSPSRLATALGAFKKLRTGSVTGREESGQRMIFEIDSVTFLTSKALLDKKTGDRSRDSSGLTTRP